MKHSLTQGGFGVRVTTDGKACDRRCQEHHGSEMFPQSRTGSQESVPPPKRHQTGGELRVPDNITLLHLPPYAPELNPMENVWEYLRANKLCNLVWDTYDAIVEACRKAWEFLISDPDRIQSIGTRKWASVKGWVGWYQFGFFFDGHRASEDCLAAVELLTLTLPKSGKLVMTALLEQARVPICRCGPPPGCPRPNRRRRHGPKGESCELLPGP